MKYDYLIENGFIVDGTGNKGFYGDIAVKEEKIVIVSPNKIHGEALKKIDATGYIVAPGFIDIHRHADAVSLTDSFGIPEVYQGITTVINGNCGLSISPCPYERRDEIEKVLSPIVGEIRKDVDLTTFSRFLEVVGEMRLRINAGYLVGNGTLRMASRGFTGGCLSQSEVERVHYLLVDAIKAGALGVSMGIVYLPECYYGHEEFVKVLEPIKGMNIPLVTHIRGEGDLLIDSIQEVIDIASCLDLPLHISHFKAVGKKNWHVGIEKGIALMDKYREKGRKIDCDTYPYTAGSSQMIQLLPPEYQEGGVDKIVERLKNKCEKDKLISIWSRPSDSFENLVYHVGWENIMLTAFATEENKKYQGMVVTEIAKDQGISPPECAVRLLIEERCAIAMVAFLMDEDDVIAALKYRYASLISDSVYPSSGMPHPRLYAAFTKMLSEYVRDKGIFTLEEAIMKMTSVPASVFNIAEKGKIKEGMDADLCIFRLSDISSEATYFDSVHYSKGMQYVFVNGVPVIENGCLNENKTGKVIKKHWHI